MLGPTSWASAVAGTVLLITVCGLEIAILTARSERIRRLFGEDPHRPLVRNFLPLAIASTLAALAGWIAGVLLGAW